MGINYLSEKLNSIRNEMSHCWGGIFVVGGGTATIAIMQMSPLKMLLLILGAVLTILLINAYFIRKNELMGVLKQLHKEDS